MRLLFIKKTKVSLVKYMNEFINTVHNNLPVTVSKNIHLRNNMRERGASKR